LWSNDQRWQTLGLISKPGRMASVTQMQRPVTSKASKNSQLGKKRSFFDGNQEKKMGVRVNLRAFSRNEENAEQ